MKKELSFLVATLCCTYSALSVKFIHHTPSDADILQQEIPPVSFYFIRHGQTNGNIVHVIQSSTNMPINAAGKRQATTAAALLKNLPIATIAVSPLLRTRMTANILANSVKAPIIVIDDLEELNTGHIAGPPYAFMRRIETQRAAKMRVKQALLKALALPGPVLIVAHGGIYTVINRLLGTSGPAYLQNGMPLLYQAPKNNGDSWHLSTVQKSSADQEKDAEVYNGTQTPTAQSYQ